MPRAQPEQLPKRSDKRGFSLLEIPITLFVMIVGLLGLHTITVVVVQSVDVAERVTVATALARDKVEEIKATAFANILEENLPSEDYGEITGSEEYARAVTIQDGVPESNSKTVDVTVSWFNAVASSTRSISVTTIIAAD